MKYFLKDILPRLKKQSASLDQSSILVDKPWVVSNSEKNFEKLIFKRDGTLYLASNGNVTEGKWEYFPEAQSLLIDYGDKKKLYRHQYLDESVLALKIDGPNNSDDDYYLLANENVVADYDAKKYLENKYVNNLLTEEVSTSNNSNSTFIKLEDGKRVEIRPSNLNIGYGKPYCEGKLLSDGEYKTNDQKTKLIVKNGNILKKRKKFTYNDNIEIWQAGEYTPQVGDRVENVTNIQISVQDGHGDILELHIKNGRVINRINKSIKTRMNYIYVLVMVIVLFLLLSAI